MRRLKMMWNLCRSQRAMEFLDTPEPGAQRPPRTPSVQSREPAAAAATAHGAEVGNVAPETPLLGAAQRPSLGEGGFCIL